MSIKTTEEMQEVVQADFDDSGIVRKTLFSGVKNS